MKHLERITFVVLLLVIGCQSFHQNAGKLLASTALTVDAAMRSWANYRVRNNVSTDAEARVKKAYEQYQLSMDAAQAAYTAMVTSGDKSIWQQAAAILQTSSASLTELIGSFTAGGTPP